MAEKSFGVKEINLIGASGTPTIESPNNLNLNAVNVAISTNATIGGTLSVTGNVSVGGTLTYEDVTNIDSVGIITAREGIIIPDTKELKIGNTASSPDLKFYHNTHSYIINKTGNLRIESDSSNLNDIQILNNKITTISDHSFNLSAKFISGGSVELYEAGNKKFETSSSGATVTGTLTATSFVKSGGTSSQYLMADGSTTTSGGGGGGGGVTVQDEGSSLSTTATTLNFVGSGVVASGTGATKTITISGGGGGVTVQDEGSSLSTTATTLNFVGSGVVASGTGATKTITISGGGSGAVSSDAQGNTVGGSGAGDSFSGTDAENNTLFGKDAGTAITTADSTTAFGKDAGKSITTGSYNHLFGIGAGDEITTGTNNTIMGHHTGSRFQTARNNTIIGGNAGSSSSLGDDNVIIGKSCNQNNGGQRNVFIGEGAISQGSGNASDNVIIGQNAAKYLTNGDYNSGVGQDVFNDITTASDNSALGHNAGNTLTTGSNNLFLGHDAVPSSASVSNEVTIGDSNINHLRVPGIGVSFSEGGAVLSGVVTATSFVGDGSNLTGISGGGGSFTTDSQFNLVAGEDAGSNFSGTSAEKNILLGHDAGRRITTGDNNIAIGDEALAASDGGNITGSGNIAIGRQAMNQKAVTGSGNVIIGDNRAGRLITSGSHNIGMGQYSLHYMATGTGNIAIGYACLDYAEGTGNVAIGHNSGTEVHGTGSSGSYNTLYGYGAGSSLSSGSNCIIIGKNAQASSNSVSDEITLGNTDVNHLRIPGIGVSFSEGGAVFSGIVTATNFAKADGTGLGGLTAESGGSANTHSNNAAGSLTSNSTNNVILGWNAGNTISTGDNNTVIGYRAGGVHNNSQETMIGANCFSEKSGHTKAVGLGFGAGKWNQGDRNTAIGYESVGANGNSSGDNNTGVGYAALRGITDGSNNVALGYAANHQHTTGSNCIVIGANANASAVDVSNEITLGDSNITKFRIPGINFILKDNGGTPTEGHVLTVDGSGEASFVGIAITEAPVTDYTISANSSSAYRIHGGGVDETANNPDLYLIRGQKYRFNNTTGSSHPFAIRVSNGGSAYTDGVSGSNQGIQFFTVPYDAPARIFYQCTIHGGMVGNIYIHGAGGQNDNVGITTFRGDLDVDGHTNLDNVNIVGVATITGALDVINSSNTTIRIYDSTGTPDSFGSIAYNNGNDADDALVIAVDGDNQQANSHMRFYVDGLTSSAEKFRVDSDGVKVTGNIDANGDLDVDGHTNLDNVSITGVTTSTGLVNINVNASQSVSNPLLLQNSAAAGTGSNPDVVKLAFGSNGAAKASIRADVYGNGAMTFHTNNDTEKLRITAGGAIGIGTATIGSNKKLDVCDGIISIQAGHTHDTRIEFYRKNTGALSWIGIPNWDPDGLYIYGPKSNSNEIASKYTSGAWHFYTSGSSNSEKLSIASDGTITTLGTTARSDWITTSLKPSFQIASNYNPWFSLFKHSSDPYGPYLLLGKTRGTTSTSNTVVENNDELGNIMFEGTDGSTFRPGARIVANVDGTPGSGDMPTRLSFHTTKDGQNNVSEKLRISSMGYVTKPEHPAFHARPPGNYSISGDQIIGGTWSTSDSESFVRGNLANGDPIWNNNTGIFTVPVTGIYFIHWNVFLKNNTTRRDAMIYNGSTVIARTEIGDPGEAANNKSVAVTAVVSLTVNDQIKFGALTTGTTNVIYETVRPWSYACGHLIG